MSVKSKPGFRAACAGVSLWVVCGFGVPAFAQAESETANSTETAPATELNAATLNAATSPATRVKPPLDRSGKKRIGRASFYANRFGGRKMADGQRMDLKDSNAASRTLPLGTTAKVTNLETGKSAVVTIQDRGPYVGGRIVDLSPSTAQKIGISKKEGIAKVAVVPIAVPLPDGSVKPGAAADDPILALNERRDRAPQSQADWDDWQDARQHEALISTRRQPATRN
jgi:rare lipoprotein A